MFYVVVVVEGEKLVGLVVVGSVVCSASGWLYYQLSRSHSHCLLLVGRQRETDDGSSWIVFD